MLRSGSGPRRIMQNSVVFHKGIALLLLLGAFPCACQQGSSEEKVSIEQPDARPSPARPGPSQPARPETTPRPVPSCVERAEPNLAAIRTAVADVYRKVPHNVDPYRRRELLATQVLFGDLLRIHNESKKGYVRVSVLDQKISSRSKRGSEAGYEWSPYPGWILESHVVPVRARLPVNAVVRIPWAGILSEPSESSSVAARVMMGTRLCTEAREGIYHRVRLAWGLKGWIASDSIRFVPTESRTVSTVSRQELISTARLLLGTPYIWGGHSLPGFQASGVRLGLDCSGLISLVYRTFGVLLPRNASDQHRKTRRIPLTELLPGDLVFHSAKARPRVIDHVMLYVGDDSFMEAPFSRRSVRIRTFKGMFGCKLSRIAAMNNQAGRRTFYGGRVVLPGAALCDRPENEMPKEEKPKRTEHPDREHPSR